MSGSYTFESASVDAAPADPTFGHYDAVTASSISVNGVTSVGGAAVIQVYNDYGGRDYYSMFSGNVTVGPYVGRWSIGLYDFDTDAFASDALPVAPPSLSDFAHERTRRRCLHG